MRGTTTAIRGRTHLGIVLLFTVLAVVHTWPLATAPGRLSRNDNADTILNEWILAWDAHQLTHDPLHLFDANIFYPDPHALAYSESMILPGAVSIPLFYAGASPVLVYNLLLLAGMIASGWMATVLVSRWTGDLWAGLLSGTVCAFGALALTRLPHVQSQHREFLLLALLFFDAVLVFRRVRDAVGVAVALVLQALTSYYTLVFTGVALVVGLLVRPEAWLPPGTRRVRRLLGLATVLTIVIVAPTLLPYLEVGRVRDLSEVAQYSASWKDYLTTPSRLEYWLLSSRWTGTTGLFPGIVALALSVVAFATGAWRGVRVRMIAAIGLAGLVLSFGPQAPLYRLLYAWVPPLWGIRAAARFGTLTVLAVGLLAGYGLAAARAMWRRAWWLGPAIVLLANVESFAGPIVYTQAVEPSALYARLADAHAVAEFPFYPPDHIFHNAQYMLNTTRYWRPILNGYSGLVPDSYCVHYGAFEDFPSPTAIGALRAAGVTHVVVHYADQIAWNGEDSVERLQRTSALQLIASDGAIGIYSLSPEGRDLASNQR